MGSPECAGCRALTKRVVELEAQVRELLARLGQNSSNSSVPPSANPLDAPKPVRKQATGRKPGGQPGHPPHLKQLVPPERVKETIHFRPAVCSKCQTRLPPEPGPHDPPP